jgi:ATP-binding cassette subfamily C protein CydD
MKENHAMNLDFRLIQQAKRAWLLLAITVTSGLVGGILIVLQARFLSKVIAGVHLNGWNLQMAEGTLYSFLIVLVGRFLIVWIGEGAAGTIAVTIKNYLRNNLLEKIERLGPVYLTGERSGEITALLVQGLDALDGYFSQFLPQLLLAALVPVCILVSVFPLDWISALVLLLTAPLLPIFMILIGGAAEKLTRKQWGALSRMSGHFLETLQGLATLKALNQSEKSGEKVRSVSEQYRLTTLKVLRVTFLSSLALELVSTISVAVVAVQIGLRLLNGGIGFEQALFILVVAPDFYLPLRQLGLRFHAATAGVSAARRIFEVLDAEEPDRNQTSLPQLTHEWKNPPSIELRNVTARYPERGEAALSGITLVLKAGSVTALVGRSGSGKSTLASLLLGFLQPETGQVMVDEVDLNSIKIKDWRKRIAWVSQAPTFFNGTLANNLSMGMDTIEDQQLWRALEICGLAGWIKSLPNGLATRVGENGLRLSSGQAQRLALSRAFLKPSGLIVLDEPTAHLDVRGEDSILNAIQALCQGRTVLLIAHRLPTLRLANHVVVLDGGKIVDEGKPEQLLNESGHLCRMVQVYSGQAK